MASLCGRSLLSGVQQERLDHLNLVDSESETAHQYSIGEVRSLPILLGEIGGQTVSDQAIDHGGGIDESFLIASIPNTDLTLVHRYRNFESGWYAEIAVDGQFAGYWEVPFDGNPLNESAFTIPGDLISSNISEIKITWEAPIMSTRWWSVEGGGGDELIDAVIR